MTRLLLIGASGLDWAGFDRLTRAGALPHLAHLRQAGAAGWLSGAPADIGAAPFATMVTGQQPEVHGLWRTHEAWAGGIRPLSRASWRAPPIWERLEAAGIAAGTVAWPGSRPGAQGPGVHIDEDFAEPSSYDPKDWALPLRCVPEDAREALRARRVHPRNITGAMLRPLVPDMDKVEATRDLDLPPMATAMASAATVQAGTMWMLETRRPEAVFVRQAWLGRIRTLFGGRTDALMTEVVQAAWRLLDGFIGALAAAAGPEAHVCLFSPGWRSLPGVLLVAGPSITTDPEFRGANIIDVAPTALGLFGLQDPGLPGRPISIVGPMRALRPAPPVAPSTPPRPEARTMYVVRRAGYRPAPRASRQWRAQGLAELAWMVLERDPAAAGRIADDALRLDPDSVLGLRTRVRAKVALEDTEGLKDLGQTLLKVAPNKPWGPLALGAERVLAGKTAQAAPWLEKAEAGSDPDGLITLGAMWLAANRPGNAGRVFQSILALEPTNTSAELGLAMSLVARRRLDEAESVLQRAAARDPGRGAIQLQLANLYAKTARRPAAERAAAEALALGVPAAHIAQARRGRLGD